jgi:hypothetical protein
MNFLGISSRAKLFWEHADELADLPKQALWVANLVNVLFFAASKANHRARNECPHPDANGYTKPADAHISGFLDYPVFPAFPPGNDPLDKLNLLWEKNKRDACW